MAAEIKDNAKNFPNAPRIMQVLKLTAIAAAEKLIVLLFLQILFCYERGFMLSLSDYNQPDVIEAFNSTSRYMDDLLNIDNPYFERMVGQIYPTELQLNKTSSLILKPPFWYWTCP